MEWLERASERKQQTASKTANKTATQQRTCLVGDAILEAVINRGVIVLADAHVALVHRGLDRTPGHRSELRGVVVADPDRLDEAGLLRGDQPGP